MAAPPKQLKSREDLYLEGWTKRLIDLALDEGDDSAPSTHWLNTQGSPLFDSRRVAVAAYRIGLSSSRPDAANLHYFDRSMRPTSVPILTVNFHFLSDLLVPGANHKFYSLRLNHPIAGRRPGSIPEEEKLISQILQAWINRVDEIQIKNRRQIENYLNDRSELALSRLGDEWKSVCVRRMRYGRYSSKASSKKSLTRALDVLSLVEAGKIVSPTGSYKPLIETLVSTPMLRFDTIPGPVEIENSLTRSA